MGAAGVTGAAPSSDAIRASIMGPILYIPGHGETFKKRADARHRFLTCLPPRALTAVTLFGDRGCPSRRHSPAVRLLRIRHEQAPSEPPKGGTDSRARFHRACSRWCVPD